MKKSAFQNFIFFQIVSCATVASAPALAQQSTPVGTASIHLDAARTTVQFSAGTLRRVHGTFQLKGGMFALDPKTGIAQGEILVDAASEKSNDSKMDKRIQGQTLETGKYPGIFFHPEKVSGTLPAKDGETHLKLDGSFNIHGADHALSVDVDTIRAGDELTFKTVFTVPYVEWGMKDASTMFMRDRKVRITVESHGSVETGPSGS